MKKRLKLKPFVLPMIYSVFVVFLLVAVFITRSRFVVEKDDDETYVTGSILDSYVPVINLDVTITRPYTNEDVKIGKDFYCYEDDTNNQTNSIVLYENLYIFSEWNVYYSNQMMNQILLIHYHTLLYYYNTLINLQLYLIYFEISSSCLFQYPLQVRSSTFP